MEHAQEKQERAAGFGLSAAERWFLHVQGRTLGPLAGEEVAFGLKTGEFLPSDKIANSRNPIWRRVSDHPVFGKVVAAEIIPRSTLLQAPPPPRLLRIKPVVPPKVPETVPARPVPELRPEAKISAPMSSAAEAAPQAPSALGTKAETSDFAHEDIAPSPTPASDSPTPSREAELSPALAKARLAPATLPLSEQEKIAVAEPDLDDPETNATLEAATAELERALANLRHTTPAKNDVEKAKEPKHSSYVAFEPDSRQIPLRPDVQPVFLTEPKPRAHARSRAFATGKRRSIQIELRLPEKPLRWIALMLIAFGMAWYAGSFARRPALSTSIPPETENKTRDLKEFPLPDPSSPTNTPPDAGDPVPRLKAPVRPQRD